MDISIEELKKWFAVHQESILYDFFTFLSFPSVSTQPHHLKDSRAAAQWLCDYLERIGLQTSLWETPGLPTVFASYLEPGPSRPVVLIYHHYDVQPAEPLELWNSDPFTPVIRNNHVYARGALDNKGQCTYTLTALKALFELAKKVDVNIKVFIEGEEESGSEGTTAILKEKKDNLRADYLLVIDFDIPDVHTPAVILGTRGIVTLDVECRNASIDLHSGTHGGIVLNPNRVLATLLAQIWDSTGKIAIDHFYDEVKPLSKKHAASIDMSFDEEKYKKMFGVNAFSREEGHAILESNWLRPTIEINGMWGGYTDTGFKTVIPAKAYAKISARLVPEQQPEVIGERIARFLKAKAPEGIVIETRVHHGAAGYRTSLDAPIIKMAARAFSEVFETPCKYQLCGASVPIIGDLARVSSAEVVLMGVGLASDDIHAPNEHFDLKRFELGFLTVARLLSSL